MDLHLSALGGAGESAEFLPRVLWEVTARIMRRGAGKAPVPTHSSVLIQHPFTSSLPSLGHLHPSDSILISLSQLSDWLEERDGTS